MLNASRYDEAGSSESSEDEETPILRETEATSTDKDMEQQKPSADVIKGQTAGNKASNPKDRIRNKCILNMCLPLGRPFRELQNEPPHDFFLMALGLQVQILMALRPHPNEHKLEPYESGG